MIRVIASNIIPNIRSPRSNNTGDVHLYSQVSPSVGASFIASRSQNFSARLPLVAPFLPSFPPFPLFLFSVHQVLETRTDGNKAIRLLFRRTRDAIGRMSFGLRIYQLLKLLRPLSGARQMKERREQSEGERDSAGVNIAGNINSFFWGMARSSYPGPVD